MARRWKSATAGSSRRLLTSLTSLDFLLHRSPPLYGGGGGGRPARSMGTLAYEEIVAPSEGPPPAATALVLHGLLGSGRNWRTFARNLASELAESSSGWRMILVDLRNHGRSAGIEGLDPPHDMVTAARDLANLVKSQNWMWPDVVIGHSMGGKVALEFADSCARGDYGESVILPKQVSFYDCLLFTLMFLFLTTAF
ncbi:hypothetical protein Taro_032852 [Colocasia esculenta]|uniref:AB hydrolase-1 domain-containing protein n=1 Tax=Colocasia esculenta TaxID=4460 RepID=A0A843W048_COLES|nr:hypothetical protein [Colocasia esculenta]